MRYGKAQEGCARRSHGQRTTSAVRTFAPLRSRAAHDAVCSLSPAGRVLHSSPDSFRASLSGQRSNCHVALPSQSSSTPGRRRRLVSKVDPAALWSQMTPPAPFSLWRNNPDPCILALIVASPFAQFNPSKRASNANEPRRTVPWQQDAFSGLQGKSRAFHAFTTTTSLLARRRAARAAPGSSATRRRNGVALVAALSCRLNIARLARR